ncbi:MAG: hypothetical protein CFE24_07090 [Flavobacterium sp. BFFFF2]|nr:MAG: hypothetical protein CFE24_07090 [Flavobacterium sp. BFFFF2]
MKYLQITSYVYLVFFGVCCFEAFTKWQAGDGNAPVMAFFAVVALFLFFFRQRFSRRFQNKK